MEIKQAKKKGVDTVLAFISFRFKKKEKYMPNRIVCR